VGCSDEREGEIWTGRGLLAGIQQSGLIRGMNKLTERPFLFREALWNGDCGGCGCFPRYRCLEMSKRCAALGQFFLLHVVAQNVSRLGTSSPCLIHLNLSLQTFCTLTTTINLPTQPICRIQTGTPPAARCLTENVSWIMVPESAPALQNQTPTLHGENSTSLGNAPLPPPPSEQRAAQPAPAAVEMTTWSAGSRNVMSVNRRDLTRFRRMSRCGSG